MKINKKCYYEAVQLKVGCGNLMRLPLRINIPRNDSKRAAMFGLDARIALAIFGALSVISGAALYSAIQSANVTQRITQIKEIEKAVEQYMLDTGEILPFSSTAPLSDMSISALVVEPSGVSGWQGPYLSFEKDTGDYLLLSSGKGMALTFSSTQDFTGAGDSLCRKSSTNCAIYVLYIAETEYNDSYEERLDGNTVVDDGGNFRAYGGHQYFKTSIPFDKSDSPNL